MTTETAEFISMAESLPIEMRIEIVNRLLESIGPTQKEIDELWMAEVERRVDEVESGAVETIPGDKVFAEIRERFGE